MLQHVVRAASAEYLKLNSISTIDWSWVIVFQLAGRAHLLLMEANSANWGCRVCDLHFCVSAHTGSEEEKCNCPTKSPIALSNK